MTVAAGDRNIPNHFFGNGSGSSCNSLSPVPCERAPPQLTSSIWADSADIWVHRVVPSNGGLIQPKVARGPIAVFLLGS